jgi:hypothetical protein
MPDSPESRHAVENPEAAVAGRAAAGDDPKAELELRGATTAKGQFKGKGTLTLFLSDAARAKIGLDYRSPDRILLSIESTGGIRLSADDSLVLSGGLTRDLVNGEIGGEVKARLKIARDLQAEIEQEFGASGPKTSVAVKLRI